MNILFIIQFFGFLKNHNWIKWIKKVSKLVVWRHWIVLTYQWVSFCSSNKHKWSSFLFLASFVSLQSLALILPPSLILLYWIDHFIFDYHLLLPCLLRIQIQNWIIHREYSFRKYFSADHSFPCSRRSNNHKSILRSIK